MRGGTAGHRYVDAAAGQRSDEQQEFETLGALRSGVAQCESEAVVLEVANSLFDLHTLRVPNSTRVLEGPANGCMSMAPLASGPAPSSRLRALRNLLSSSAVLDAPATSPGLGAGGC